MGGVSASVHRRGRDVGMGRTHGEGVEGVYRGGGFEEGGAEIEISRAA